MDDTRKDTTAIDIFTVIAILLIIGLPVYGYFKLKPDRIFNIDKTSQEVDESTQDNEPTDEIPPVVDDEEEEEEIIEPIEITGYTEELVEIDEQWAYIAAPEPIDPNNLPILILYNHGTETRVEENLDEDFKQDLIVYAKTATPKNYIFAVSNARGLDLDTPEAVNDNYNLYKYVRDNYGTKEKIYLTGYSKGGVTTLNFASIYPNLVTKIGMIAPTMRLDEWDRERAQSLQGIDIKVWHGTDDVNVRFDNSTRFIEQMKDWGIEISIVPLEGKDHWNVNPQYFDEVVKFFNSSETFPE